jgi:hypothetical protein
MFVIGDRKIKRNLFVIERFAVGPRNLFFRSGTSICPSFLVKPFIQRIGEGESKEGRDRHGSGASQKL